MEVKIINDYQELSRIVGYEIVHLVRLKPDAVICLPSGHTPLGLFDELADQHNRKLADFSRCIFIGLDEWLGMDEHDQGSCKYLMYTLLFDRLGLKREQIHFFDAKTTDPGQECKRIDRIIALLGGIDIMVLGIGMNGHLGLNEPGTDPGLYAHVTELDTVTKQIGQKYFTESIPLTQGITLGIRHIMESRKVILMASGVKKAAIVKQLLEGNIGNMLPASLVREHPDAVLYLDKEAAGN